MEVRIGGKTAVVKSGSNVQYVVENRAFSKSDSYTLSIEFPLKNCQQNIDIFGHLNRHDVDRGLIRLDAELTCGPTFSRYGTLTVVSANEESVKCQFLEGRSASNYDTTFDDIYINEIQITPPDIPMTMLTVDDWLCYKSIDDTPYICIPWVNDGSGLLQNAVDMTTHKLKTTHPTPMYFLLSLTRLILDSTGYSYDLSEWNATKHRHLLCCNVLPAAWESMNIASALPHWTLTEYLEQLELFLGGDFDIDHTAKTIEFHYAKAHNDSLPLVAIDNVTDDFDVETSEKDDTGFADTKVYKYSSRDDDDWQYLSCQDLIDGYNSHYYEFPLWLTFFRALLNGDSSTYANLLKYTPNFTQTAGAYSYFHNLYRVKEYDTYFAMRCIATWEDGTSKTTSGANVKFNSNKPQMLNIYGKSMDNAPENTTEEEINIVPARIDWTDYGYAVFVPVPSDSGATDSVDTFTTYEQIPARSSFIWGDTRKTNIYNNNFTDDFTATWRSSTPIRAIENDTDSTEYLSSLFVAYWDGTNYYGKHDSALQACPIVDKLTFYDQGASLDEPLYLPQYSMRLSDRESAYPTTTADGTKKSAVNVKTKYTFSFLADSVPDPRAVFLVHGQKFICGKITATLEDNGLKRLMKGEFYRLDS